MYCFCSCFSLSFFSIFFSFFFFFNDTATTEIYTLSLTTLFRSHSRIFQRPRTVGRAAGRDVPRSVHWEALILHRSEEHTSELQSRVDLVCRLLLEKKKKKQKILK